MRNELRPFEAPLRDAPQGEGKQQQASMFQLISSRYYQGANIHAAVAGGAA